LLKATSSSQEVVIMRALRSEELGGPAVLDIVDVPDPVI
jgi:hypothetical protein